LILAAFALAACGGTAERDSIEAAAGGSAIGGQNAGFAGASHGGSGPSGAGGRAGSGAAGFNGIDAGTPPLDAGADSGTEPIVVYRAVVTNPINSGEDVTFTRADALTNTCVFFTTFVGVGGAPLPVSTVFATPGAESCCPSNPNFAALCDTGGGCPVSSSVSGAIGGDAVSGFDVDLSIEFSQPRMWLPSLVRFRASSLGYSVCD
jgi:hypothetical protein